MKYGKSGREMRFMGRWAGVLVAAALLAGCATSGNPRDPLESVNRAIFGFNDGFDQAIAKPVAEGYRKVVPSFARTGVTNFFSNLEDLWIVVNDLLQGKPRKGLDGWARVFLNTTIGVLGLYDIASDVGLDKQNEDFGQTLGSWGVGSGPYIVLPFLGPSTLRDALSYGLVDVHADFVSQYHKVPTRNTMYVTRAINYRANLLDASRVVEEAALDKYTFTRDAFLQRRQSLVYDGNPPRDASAAAEAIDEEETATAQAETSASVTPDPKTDSSPNAAPLAGVPAASPR
jgi:phospholipid-binding lipoprotein MlaA